jgi:hypothetical protein
VHCFTNHVVEWHLTPVEHDLVKTIGNEGRFKTHGHGAIGAGLFRASSYRKRVVAPVLVAATKAEQFDALMGNAAPGSAVEPTAAAIARAAPVLRRLAKRYQQINQHIARSGQDSKTFTSLVNADRGLMELEAKVTGLYTDAPRADMGFMPCVVVQVQMTAAPVAPAEAMPIDVAPEE